MTKFRSSLILLILISMIGCSSSNDNTVILDATGKHPAGWSSAGSHGSAVKAETPGLGSCAGCHGADYKEAGKSCMTCHTTAPHPQAPWHGTTASGTTHTTTNQSNATECSRCHAGGAKLTTPAAAIVGATCFNNMLCHGSVGHPAGWEATGHQIAAKAAAGASTGLDYCRKCHGTDFSGGTTGFSCFQCHTSSPHSKPWLGSTGATTHKHSSTDATNALACGRCHAGGVKLLIPVTPPANSGCFNSTLCHASATGHTFPYPGSAHLGAANDAGCLTCHAQGNATSSYPVTAGALPNCRGCHLTANPGTTPQCSDCHGTVANNSAGATMAGRPVGGTTFPNRPGMHNISGHVDWPCTVCHPFTTGDPRHGWSNGGQSTAAQVGGTRSNLISSWNASTKSCTALCHTDPTAIKNW